ncbi:MAG: hypothetical protein PHF67_00340 [Candidatus Nanoarchaeia archaeon]|nr:hypothetical protein [Candidatus Nanoarchaeia archaeon]
MNLDSETKKRVHIVRFGKGPKSFITFEKKLSHRLFRFMHHFHYPKITLLIILIIIAYYMFRNPAVNGLVSHLNNWSYLGVFLAGMLFSFGFTTPFAIGFFIILNPQNPILTGLLGGFGALISDLFIFKFIRFSFKDEFKRLEKTRLIKKISSLIEISLGHKISVYFIYVFAGVIIASPLPDEIGVLMLAGVTKIKPFVFSALSFIFNSLGIMIMLLI